MSSAYGIVTPYPGTKFYEDLDNQGLIFESDWNRFDEMHSVFKAKNLSSERIEELASICMAKFWTVDTFIERERVRLNAFGKKKPLLKFIGDRLSDLSFGAGSGPQLQPSNFDKHVQRILEASPDPSIKNYTKKVGVHNVLEMSRFLRLLGKQKIQVTVRNNGSALISWVYKSTINKVEYIDVIHGKSKDCTINFDIDINDLLKDGQPHSSKKDGLRVVAKMFGSNKGMKKQFNLFRLLFAAGIELISYKSKKNGKVAKGKIRS